MLDNGLLETFGNKPFENGAQKIKETESDFRLLAGTYNRPILQGTIGGRSYFIKDCPNKMAVDAEVLLSQVYAKAGFKTAIYLPLSAGVKIDNFDCSPRFATYNLTQNGFGVVSNDVSYGGNTTDYDSFTQKNFDAPWNLSPIFPRRAGMGYNYKDYFTKDGARDFIKMHVFDIATSNFDRRTQNFLVETNDDGKIDGVRLFDFGASAWLNWRMGFYSYLGTLLDVRSRSGMITELKDNDSVMDIMFPYEMAEEVRHLDFEGVAKDIEENIDYKISPEFVARMKITSDALANDLERYEEQ